MPISNFLQHKDDPDKWAELKRLQIEYERKRNALFNYYESVKNAQQVQVIFLLEKTT